MTVREVRGQASQDVAKISWPLVEGWLGLRFVTTMWMAWASAFLPYSELEQQVAAWPPTVPLGQWLQRVLLAPAWRWDVTYYLRIVTQGYAATDGTAQFHPLFPWLAKPLAWLTGNPLLALTLVSSLAGLAFLWVYACWLRERVSSSQALWGAWILACSPFAFVLFVPYTEALFLLCAVLAFWGAERERWWLAGLAGGLAALTRQQGILLLLPLAVMFWQAHDGRWEALRVAWRQALGLALVPAGLVAWLLYRAVALGDLHVELTGLNTLIYSLLISPSAGQVVPQQRFDWPWWVLFTALCQFWQAPDVGQAVDLVLGGVFVALLVGSWHHLRLQERVYVLATTLVSFSYYTGSAYPYMGLPRHLLLGFPVFSVLAVAPHLQARRRQLEWMGWSLLGLFFLLLLYVAHSWVP